MIVLWNTVYMNAVLDQLRTEGYEVRPEDEARLSPFGHDHANMLGRFPSPSQMPSHVANCDRSEPQTNPEHYNQAQP